MYDASCDSDKVSSEPPNPDRDKFKVPLPKRSSAFTPVIRKAYNTPSAAEKAAEDPTPNTNDYILRKALRSLAGATDADKIKTLTYNSIKDDWVQKSVIATYATKNMNLNDQELMKIVYAVSQNSPTDSSQSIPNITGSNPSSYKIKYLIRDSSSNKNGKITVLYEPWQEPVLQKPVIKTLLNVPTIDDDFLDSTKSISDHWYSAEEGKLDYFSSKLLPYLLILINDI